MMMMMMMIVCVWPPTSRINEPLTRYSKFCTFVSQGFKLFFWIHFINPPFNLLVHFWSDINLYVCAFVNTYQRRHLFEYTPTNRGLTPVGNVPGLNWIPSWVHIQEDVCVCVSVGIGRLCAISSSHYSTACAPSSRYCFFSSSSSSSSLCSACSSSAESKSPISLVYCLITALCLLSIMFINYLNRCYILNL